MLIATGKILVTEVHPALTHIVEMLKPGGYAALYLLYLNEVRAF
jgi:hypothetical protein